MKWVEHLRIVKQIFTLMKKKSREKEKLLMKRKREQSKEQS